MTHVVDVSMLEALMRVHEMLQKGSERIAGSGCAMYSLVPSYMKNEDVQP